MTDKEKKAIKDCDSIFICLDDAMSEDSAKSYISRDFGTFRKGVDI